jgi:two-component system sensor histidine kinase UhpB
MADLRPPALDEYGLAAALRAYIASFTASTGLPVLFEGRDSAPRLASVKETALFRIAQEALTNAAKHARARSVRVTLATNETSIVLTIADDGAGFAAEPSRPAAPTWGLTTMHERAEAIGARLKVESHVGHGTTVMVDIDR